jgi:hypothetical protein
MLRRVALLRTVRRLLVTANIFPSSPIFVTVMMEVIHFSGMLVRSRATRRNNPLDGILHGHRRENLRSHIDNMFPLFLSPKPSMFE